MKWMLPCVLLCSIWPLVTNLVVVWYQNDGYDGGNDNIVADGCNERERATRANIYTYLRTTHEMNDDDATSKT